MKNLKILPKEKLEFNRILTGKALKFVESLVREFRNERDRLLHWRQQRSEQIKNGLHPNFLPETKNIRDENWKIAPIPKELQDRRVEITSPSGDPKMVINAFNSGANIYMSDFEDSQAPTWENTIVGQLNLFDAVRGNFGYKSPEKKKYFLNDKRATLIVRPRGWHLNENHILVDDTPIPASLFDFGLFFYHNAYKLIESGSGPYFYLPKLESHLEARLWNNIFIFAQDKLGIPQGTIKATVLIETILAAFEMDEILYQLKDHSAGLNCGRWDYIFSYIKKFNHDPNFTLPDRAEVTMDKGFLAAYVKFLIQTCHRRGAHAIGGMAAQIPIKNNPEANELAMEKVRADKIREVTLGHDGTWVAHPGLVTLAKEVFDRDMAGPNQIDKQTDVRINADDLLKAPRGEITLDGLKTNVKVGLYYLESWLRGTGCVPINNLMEDAATAEICRSQIWQWNKHGIKTKEGEEINHLLINWVIADELCQIRAVLGDEKFKKGKYYEAADLLRRISTDSTFYDFLTVPAYDILLKDEMRKNL